MKNKYHFFPGLLFLSVLLTFSCSSEPVTVATSADGVEINFINQGKGEQAILLVHGWTNDNTIWDPQVPVLSEKYQVIAVDLAGHGKSGNNRTEWTISRFGEDIAAVVNAAELKNVILVGFSMGGPAILEAAKILPDQVSGLILVDIIKNPEEQYPPPVIHWIDSIYMDLIEDPNAEKAVQLGFLKSNAEENIEKIKVMLDRDRTGWRDCLLDTFRWLNEDCVGSLESLKVPLMAINADDIPTAVDVYKKYDPDFEVRILSGTGHVMMWEVTEAFNKALDESIQSILSKNQNL